MSEIMQNPLESHRSEKKMQQPLTCVEICAGAGGQALGLAMAGFIHVALVEYEKDYCTVLKQNRPEWNVICDDVRHFDGRPYKGVDLLAGGVPCPPFSVAGKQLGQDDERDLFPEAIRLIKEIQPRAVMLENVRGFLDPSFADYREHILSSIRKRTKSASIIPAANASTGNKYRTTSGQFLSDMLTPSNSIFPVCAFANTWSRMMYEYASINPPDAANTIPNSIDSDICFAIFFIPIAPLSQLYHPVQTPCFHLE